MENTETKPLPTALYLTLIVVGWLLFGVIGSGAEALFHFMPTHAPVLEILHRASPLLLVGWGITGLFGIGVFATRGRRPYACIVFLALFFAGYVLLAPQLFQRVTIGVWIAGLGVALSVVGGWQLVERDRKLPTTVRDTDT